MCLNHNISRLDSFLPPEEMSMEKPFRLTNTILVTGNPKTKIHHWHSVAGKAILAGNGKTNHPEPHKSDPSKSKKTNLVLHLMLH